MRIKFERLRNQVKFQVSDGPLSGAVYTLSFPADGDEEQLKNVIRRFLSKQFASLAQSRKFRLGTTGEFEV